MRKKLLVGILAIGIMITGVGCMDSVPNQPKNADSANVMENPPQGDCQLAVEVLAKRGKGIDYEIHTPAFLENDLQEALGYIQMHRGFGIMKEVEDGLYIYVGLGEKPTDGYYVDIEDVVREEDRVKIIVKEIKPEEDGMKADVITFPSTVIKLLGKPSEIIVMKDNGELFTNINNENEELIDDNTARGVTEIISTESKVDLGVFVGQIDSNSVEIIVENKAGAFQLTDEAKEMLKNIEDGMKVKITYDEVAQSTDGGETFIVNVLTKIEKQ